MSLKKYIFLMLVTTIACYSAFFSVLYFLDPFVGGLLVLIFFYASFFMALLGTFALLGLFLRIIFTKDRLIFKKVISSFRQAIWFALLIIISLILNKLDIFAWTNIILLIFALVMIEIFFISYKSKPSVKI